MHHGNPIEDDLWWELDRSRAVLHLRGIGSSEVRPGCTPSVTLEPGRAPDDAEVLLAATVPMGVLLGGAWPLRGSAVEIDGRAVVVIGGPAGGVSTAAAALIGLGGRLLADNHVDVRTTPSARVHESATTIDVWPDAVRALGWPDGSGRQIRRGVAKRRVDCTAPTCGPVEVAAIVALAIDPLVGHAVLEPIHGFAAVRRITAAAWHGWAIDRLGLTPGHLAWLVPLAATVPVIRLRVPKTTGGPLDTVHAAGSVYEMLLRRPPAEL
jgi:hypothetical protein